MKQYKKGYSKSDGKYTIKKRVFGLFWKTAFAFQWKHKRDRHLTKLEKVLSYVD